MHQDRNYTKRDEKGCLLLTAKNATADVANTALFLIKVDQTTLSSRSTVHAVDVHFTALFITPIKRASLKSSDNYLPEPNSIGVP